VSPARTGLLRAPQSVAGCAIRYPRRLADGNPGRNPGGCSEKFANAIPPRRNELRAGSAPGPVTGLAFPPPSISPAYEGLRPQSGEDKSPHPNFHDASPAIRCPPFSVVKNPRDAFTRPGVSSRGRPAFVWFSSSRRLSLVLDGRPPFAERRPEFFPRPKR